MIADSVFFIGLKLGSVGTWSVCQIFHVWTAVTVLACSVVLGIILGRALRGKSN